MNIQPARINRIVPALLNDVGLPENLGHISRKIAILTGKLTMNHQIYGLTADFQTNP
jgi:hypothetical protein